MPPFLSDYDSDGELSGERVSRLALVGHAANVDEIFEQQSDSPSDEVVVRTPSLVKLVEI